MLSEKVINVITISNVKRNIKTSKVEFEHRLLCLHPVMPKRQSRKLVQQVPDQTSDDHLHKCSVNRCIEQLSSWVGAPFTAYTGLVQASEEKQDNIHEQITDTMSLGWII